MHTGNEHGGIRVEHQFHPQDMRMICSQSHHWNAITNCNSESRATMRFHATRLCRRWLMRRLFLLCWWWLLMMLLLCFPTTTIARLPGLRHSFNNLIPFPANGPLTITSPGFLECGHIHFLLINVVVNEGPLGNQRVYIPRHKV